MRIDGLEAGQQLDALKDDGLPLERLCKSSDLHWTLLHTRSTGWEEVDAWLKRSVAHFD